ncbi:MAG: BMP family ABC transporter substrate-binding protein [Treponema sp.]|nr:BMP family ABC transporter substrate-binding protein [Treponema sp.]
MSNGTSRGRGLSLFGILLPCLAVLSLAVCARRQEASSGQVPSIAVFIPGVMSGSPIYEMLAQGVERAAAEFSAEVAVIEGGVNQAEWESKLTALAAGGSYDLIVSSNPSLPALAQSVSARFPDQHFLLLDGAVQGNPRIYAMRYNQREQAYMAGHIAALTAADLAESGGPGRAGEPRISLVAGQEYPVMNTIILPGYREGALAAAPGCTVDFRVVGNWFDAGKAAELAADMIRGGAGAILCIAGGANEGVLQAAAENGARVIWFDTNGYALRPGTVAGSSILRQDRAAYEKTRDYLEGRLPFGSSELVGVAEGYVDFIQDDPDYTAAVKPEIREKQAALVDQIRSGRLILEE